MDSDLGGGFAEDRCQWCHEDCRVVVFPCKPIGGCTLKLCPVCIKEFVHHGSRCLLCHETNVTERVVFRPIEILPYQDPRVGLDVVLMAEAVAFSIGSLVVCTILMFGMNWVYMHLANP